MDRPDAWMPHYIGDYLMETIHLTAQQDGIYMRLRAHYWKSGGPISADPDILYRAARASSFEEKLDVNLIVGSFFKMEGDCVRHLELDRRYQEAWERYKKKSDAGKKAVAVREQKKQKRSNDASNDEQTTTRTRTKRKKEKENHHQPVDAESLSDSIAPTRMTVQEFRQLHLQSFNSVMNENQNAQATIICEHVPKDYIQDIFRIVTENGINDFSHVLSHLKNKLKF